MKYLFGPVPSRRLGVSLGIDLVPFKTCTLDCVYCECGKTNRLTMERKEYVPTQAVLEELREYLAGEPALDYITFSGSGEPTLHSHIGEVIDFLKKNYGHYRVAVLTNGTLLTEREVRSQLMGADRVIPSLDAVSENAFQKINRPHPAIKNVDVISGLKRFSREYGGELYLEVFIVPGINDTTEELNLLKQAIQEINPQRVQLNSLDRPGTEDWVSAADSTAAQEIAAYLGGRVEIIGAFSSRHRITGFSKDRERDIISVLQRRPCTEEDLARILNLRLAEVHKYIRFLVDKGIVRYEQRERGGFFKLAKLYQQK